MTGASPSKRGFTLIELMVVITILGVLAVVVAGEFKGTREEANLRASTRQLVMILHFASSQAVTTGLPHRVRLDREEGRFRLEFLDGEETTVRYRPADHLPRWEGQLAAGIAWRLRRGEDDAPEDRRRARFERDREEVDAIRFRPDGTSESREIELRDRRGSGIVLSVDPITSRVRTRPLERPAGRRSEP